MWILYVVALSTAIVCCTAQIGSYDYDNKIEEPVANDRDNLTSNVSVLPDQIFNSGKAFYVKKDASGSIDFNAKTTPESLPTPTDAVSTSSSTVNSSRKHDINIDNTVRAQNIHDYLNLPVKYQSSKFVYPLVSSSYANLKYQGNNKNFMSNHKFDSSTMKSVAYTTKKYKTTFPSKSYTTAYAKSSTTESIESTTRATIFASNSTRKYANIPSRGSTPGRRYTPVTRVSSTTVRNSLPNEVKYTRGRSTTEKPIEADVLAVTPTIASENAVPVSTTTVVPNKGINVTESEKEHDSMNIGDLFSYFFNNEESEEADASKPSTKATPSTTVMTLRPTVSTTNAPTPTKDDIVKYNRYNVTLDSATRRPINRPTTPEYTTSTVRPTEPIGDRIALASTASPLIGDYGDRNSVNSGKFRPPTNFNNIHVSPNAQTASFVTNGQVSAGFGNVHQYSDQNAQIGPFQAPPQNGNSIVVTPDRTAAVNVQTNTRFEKPTPVENIRRPVAGINEIDETTKAGITFISKGQVTSADAYDHPSNNKVVFHGPSSNSNNIVVAPGTHTATFVTSSQMALGDRQPGQQPAKTIENEINAFGPALHSSQKPHGFQLPSTTSIPKLVSTVIAQSVTNENETQHVRFPENANGANVESALIQPEQISNSDNTIKFPSNQVPQAAQQVAHAAQAPQVSQVTQVVPIAMGDGIVKFTDIRNEIIDGIDPNIKVMQAPTIGASNFVVFRPQQPMAMQQPPLVMGLTLPQMIRNTPFVFKKPTFVHYPRKNYTLPNILPQFRPTQVQQPISLSPEIANQLRQGQINRAQYMYNAQNLRFKSPMQFPAVYNQRPMQIRPSVEQMQNRRHFELHPGNFNRIYDRPMLPQMFNPNIGANALLIEPQRFKENMKVTGINGDDSSKNVDFENGDAKLIGVQPIVESLKEIPKVEPVTTLQMIQQQRLLQKTGAVTMNGVAANRNVTTDTNGKTEKPLYVVYPMQKTTGVHRGNGEIATILAEQTNKPATIQQLGLPYTLEKHKSRYILNSRPAYEFEKKSEQQDPIAAQNDEEDSDRPIAIAYSPTEPNPSHLADVYRPTPAHHSTPVFVNAANDENVNANQHFQAPFIPSINLEQTQSTHNGWAIVTPPSFPSGLNPEMKSNRISASLANPGAGLASISRSDSVESAEGEASVETSTKKFDFEHFNPDLQGGFVPIIKSSVAPEKQITESVKAADEISDRSDISLESLIYDDDAI